MKWWLLVEMVTEEANSKIFNKLESWSCPGYQSDEYFSICPSLFWF